MQPYDSPHVSPPISFKVTIIDEQVLIVRLTTELHRFSEELRSTFDELRKDPRESLKSMLSATLSAAKCRLTLTNLFGFTSAVLMIVLAALLFTAIDRTHVIGERKDAADRESVDKPVMLFLTALSNVPSIYPPSNGRVGLRTGAGEGSARQPANAQGGGSGGLGDLAPAQRGKVPQPSEIPSIIPKAPPVNTTSLPAAGVDLDPALWSDIKYPVYGNPRSPSDLPSNGPGQDGGMGTNRGLGIGDGDGNGFGSGNFGNTGGGNRQIGWGGGGGTGGGRAGSLGPLRGNEVDEKARLLSKPEPHYSEEARRQGITGTVVLRVVFTSTGQVTQIRAIQQLPFGLTERAIEAAREIKFQPAKKGGRSVSVYMQLEYNFNLY
jgi:TonB family protein